MNFCTVASEHNKLVRKVWVRDWVPAMLMMLIIFVFSSRPSAELPNFGYLDTFVKKGGHVVGYGLLALAYWRGFSLAYSKKWLAWGLAICYALTDELHQAFVPGRHPALMNVLLFDNIGAVLGLALWGRFVVQKHKS